MTTDDNKLAVVFLRKETKTRENKRSSRNIPIDLLYLFLCLLLIFFCVVFLFFFSFSSFFCVVGCVRRPLRSQSDLFFFTIFVLLFSSSSRGWG